MKHTAIMLLAAAMTISNSCQNAATEVEIHPIQDNVQPRMM